MNGKNEMYPYSHETEQKAKIPGVMWNMSSRNFSLIVTVLFMLFVLEIFLQYV